MESNQAASSSEIILSLPEQVKISLPKKLSCLSTYILKEQGDWFEEEIKFLRNYLRPTMQVIDIGANYGMYTLSMAKTIGEKGNIWAFEPDTATLSHLQRSIRLNHFDHVQLVDRGLSNRQGEATFYISEKSEMSSLNSEPGSGATEIIQLSTLDQSMVDYQWSNIDFIKLDAEGEEGRIIEGAAGLLDKMSPLIMFELKHVRKINLPLIIQFAALGYQTYRLVRGPQVLVPFDPQQPFDAYQLNLFCCKQDKAAQLEQDGVLVQQIEQVAIETKGRAQSYLKQRPFSAVISRPSKTGLTMAMSYQEMLDYYVASLDPSVSNGQRIACLQKSMALSTQIRSKANNGDDLGMPQLACHVRIATDAGARFEAVNLVRKFLDSERMQNTVRLMPIFLPALERYELIDPDDQLDNWLLSSLVEVWVKDHSYSSYFTGFKAQPELNRLARLGFMDREMTQRYDFVAPLGFRKP